MRLPPVLLMSMALSARVSSGGQQQAQPLPPANVGDTRAPAVAPPPAIAPMPSNNAKHIVYNGTGGYVLPDGTTAAGDGSGGFRLPNGAYIFPDGTSGVTLPNGMRCTSDGARGTCVHEEGSSGRPRRAHDLECHDLRRPALIDQAPLVGPYHAAMI